MNGDQRNTATSTHYVYRDIGNYSGQERLYYNADNFVTEFSTVVTPPITSVEGDVHYLGDTFTSYDEIFAAAKQYFDAHGVGTATIDIPAGGVNLTFTSASQGISNDKFVTGDTEITITPTKKNVDITVNSVVGDVVTIKDR